jgi:hypothetical protein
VPYYFKVVPYWSVIIVLSTFFAIVQCIANPGLQCTSRPPSCFNSTGGTSKGIVNLISAYEKADRLLEQKRTGSQYDKNEQLTLESQLKLAFT